MSSHLIEPISSELFVRNAISLAAFMLTLCEWTRGFEDEFEFIWRRPMSWMKGLYLVTRYTVLIGSIMSALLLFGPLKSFPNSDDDCRKWFALFTVVSCIPVFAIDTFSTIRIYVLYKGDLKTSAIAASLILTEVAFVTLSSAKAINDAVFTSACGVVNAPRDVVGFAGWLIVTQLVFIIYTFRKLKSVSNNLHASTVYLVLYQGMALCSLIVVLLAITISYTLIDNTRTSDPNIIAICPATISSSAFCRVVLNLHRRRQQQADRNREKSELDIQLTSWFSTDTCEEGQDPMLQDNHATLRRRLCSSSKRNSGSPPSVKSSS
ncbi:hypothetical protein BKA70DRAFT_1344788 [Coprinopsis sp. MPI-PUGE-AT-0042]|nr:hypothetical protein BKA70DRAFT_1344788 [Coprinopsis sp. MPI-PUGE-AT-0042]